MPTRERTARRRRRIRGALRLLALVALAVVLPFFVLLKTSVYLYEARDLGTWLSLAGGALLTFVLLLLYAAVLSKKLRGRVRLPRFLVRALLAVVAAYCVYGLVYVSGANVKNEAVRARYTALHPLLRVASSTLVLADSDVLITDTGRTPEDYERMGIPVNERSLHFVQDDGFVHALDLRTVGRSELRNRLTELYFRVMGFRTLRHVGTADHLHVSLPLAGG